MKIKSIFIEKKDRLTKKNNLFTFSHIVDFMKFYFTKILELFKKK